METIGKKNLKQMKTDMYHYLSNSDAVTNKSKAEFTQKQIEIFNSFLEKNALHINDAHTNKTTGTRKYIKSLQALLFKITERIDGYSEFFDTQRLKDFRDEITYKLVLVQVNTFSKKLNKILNPDKASLTSVEKIKKQIDDKNRYINMSIINLYRQILAHDETLKRYADTKKLENLDEIVNIKERYVQQLDFLKDNEKIPNEFVKVGGLGLSEFSDKLHRDFLGKLKISQKELRDPDFVPKKSVTEKKYLEVPEKPDSKTPLFEPEIALIDMLTETQQRPEKEVLIANRCGINLNSDSPVFIEKFDNILELIEQVI